MSSRRIGPMPRRGGGAPAAIISHPRQLRFRAPQQPSRGRDTLTTVPSIGNCRRCYTSPNDELTRIWIEYNTYPIGGVNPEVRWGYSQAGLLLADTSQGNRWSSTSTMPWPATA